MFCKICVICIWGNVLVKPKTQIAVLKLNSCAGLNKNDYDNNWTIYACHSTPLAIITMIYRLKYRILVSLLKIKESSIGWILYLWITNKPTTVLTISLTIIIMIYRLKYQFLVSLFIKESSTVVNFFLWITDKPTRVIAKPVGVDKKYLSRLFNEWTVAVDETVFSCSTNKRQPVVVPSLSKNCLPTIHLIASELSAFLYRTRYGRKSIVLSEKMLTFFKFIKSIANRRRFSMARYARHTDPIDRNRLELIFDRSWRFFFLTPIDRNFLK